MANNRRLLELALKGLETERSLIDQEIKELTSQLNGQGVGNGRNARKTQTRVVARGAENGLTAPTPKRRGTLTPAGRRKLSEAAKRRWAANRKTGKTTL
jgi:hypothetical protein